MKPLLLSLAAWAGAAATAYFLSHDHSAGSYAALFVLPAIAVALTVLSRGSSVSNRAFRIAWWIMTLATWFIVALVAVGRWEKTLFANDDHQQLLIAGGIAWIAGIWSMVKSRAFPTRRAFVDASVAVALLGAMVTAIFQYREFRARSMEQAARERWSEIGLPMNSFGASLKPQRANKALNTLAEVMRQFLNCSIYQQSDTPARINHPPALAEALGLLTQPLPAGDVLPSTPTPKLDLSAKDLASAYERILSEEAPVWAANPADYSRNHAPNYLAVRQLVQLMAGDAIRRMERGDQDGARLAMKAAHRIIEGLAKDSRLMSLMIRVAVDSHLAWIEARLPVEHGALEKIAVDRENYIAALQKAVQMESLNLLRADLLTDSPVDPDSELAANLRFPSLAQRLLYGPVLRQNSQLTALVNAECVAVLKDPKLISSPDLGASRFVKIAETNAARTSSEIQRSYVRMCATLLLREQSALLRQAREQLALGQTTLESRKSVVLPERSWMFSVDPVTSAVAIRLDEVPPWIAEQEVVPDSFWVLPLDGSKSWQFKVPARAASR